MPTDPTTSLRARKRELEQELARIEKALALLAKEQPKRKPRVSAETREKMSAGQKKRYANGKKLGNDKPQRIVTTNQVSVS